MQKNSKSRFLLITSHIQLSNIFIVPEVDLQSTGLFKHVDKKVESHMGQTKSKTRKIALPGDRCGWEIGPML